jgi:hypothetical protein
MGNNGESIVGRAAEVKNDEVVNHVTSSDLSSIRWQPLQKL